MAVLDYLPVVSKITKIMTGIFISIRVYWAVYIRLSALLL